MDEDWQNGDDGPLYYEIDSITGSSLGYDQEFKQHGTVTATMTWIHDDLSHPENDPPPTRQWIKETAWADWNGLRNGSGTGVVSGTGDDGLGDAAPPAAVSDGYYYYISSESSGTHLHQVDSSSGVITRSCALDCSAKLVSPTGDWDVQTECGYQIAIDTRAVTLHRDDAHDETVDPDGTVHGDTTYSYTDKEHHEYDPDRGRRLPAFTIEDMENWQYFHPQFSGYWSPAQSGGGLDGFHPLCPYDISWIWNPAESDDTWNTGQWEMPYGSVNMEDADWVGTPTGASTHAMTYSVTDNGDGAKATAAYILTRHDKYDNWRRVDALGNSLGQGTQGEPGDLVQIAEDTLPMPAQPSLSYQDPAASWSIAGNVAGGVISGAGTMLSVTKNVWVAVALGLIGTALQTVSSLPPAESHTLGPPDAFSASLLQGALASYQYDQSAPPGEPQDDHNLVDASFANYLAHSQDFNGYFNGNYGEVTVDVTLFSQTLNYYFLYDEYDEGGLVGRNNSATVNRPGGLVWKYLWHYSGDGVPLSPGG